MQVISPTLKLKSIDQYWSPAIIGKVNDSLIKVAKIKDQFVWHSHDNEDELFLVVSGTLKMNFRDRAELVNAGEFIVVPKGVEHCPESVSDETHIMLIEPSTTMHTGDVVHRLTNNNQEWI